MAKNQKKTKTKKMVKRAVKMTPKNVKQLEKAEVEKDKLSIPASLLAPVRTFLQEQLAKLEKTRKEVSKQDPFKNSSRISNNASPDTDAEEQFGHARTSAIKEQLDRRIIQTKKALSRLKIGRYGICEDCGQMIDTDRLMIYPDATLCAKDQARREK